uniref:Uncharacterized protein n=1 Tax=Rhizophora mucronata TaxID=61149 RepID=A0A2P2NU24_RHIMU
MLKDKINLEKGTKIHLLLELKRLLTKEYGRWARDLGE